MLRVEYGKPCFTLHENPSLAFPLHRVEYRSKPMPHSTQKPVDHDTDTYYLYNHVSSGNSSVARKVLATPTCEVYSQQLTTHNKHQFHDSQSSSHHTIQTLHSAEAEFSEYSYDPPGSLPRAAVRGAAGRRAACVRGPPR
jgi:hypothetical protein